MARFRHPLKLLAVSKEELESMLISKSQLKVDARFGVTQMTVCRHAKRLGIVIDKEIWKK